MKKTSTPKNQAPQSAGGTVRKEVELDNATWAWLEKVASLSGVTVDQALCVTLAGKVVRA